MLDMSLILPKRIDNNFVGNKVSLWFFYLLTAMTLWRSQHHLFAADGGAQSIATIPLDSYSSNASAAIIGIFALWGLSQLIIAFMYLLTCVRYRALIPLMYLLGIVEYAVRAFYVGSIKPINTAGNAPGGSINIPFMLIFTVMLFLALWRRNEAQN